MATAAPLPRHVSLDVVRGIAVMGILLMNIVAFAMPSPAYFNPTAFGGDGALDIAVWGANFVLADGKMRGLFSVLFGASMLLVIERAEAKGENGALTHFSRMTWLLLFGAIHAYAIWFGDILMLYAVVGLIAFFFRAMETHRLVILGLILIVIEAIIMGQFAFSFWQLRAAALPPGAEAATIAAWAEMNAAFGPLATDALAENLALYRGGYGGIVADRLGPHFWAPIANNLFWMPETLGLMVLGMAGLKSGFLTGRWERARYLRYALRGYLIGLPLQMLLALWILLSGFELAALITADFALQTLVNPFVVLGHAGLILYWVKSAGESAMRERVAAAGRAAFSNYLGTSIVCTFIFYGYGLGLYGEISRAALYIVVFGVWALILLWSKPWLDRFRYGPLEWLWRSLARRQFQPLWRIKTIAT